MTSLTMSWPSSSGCPGTDVNQNDDNDDNDDDDDNNDDNMITSLTMSSPSSSGLPGTGSSSGLGWGSVTRKQAKIWTEKYKPEIIVIKIY